MTRALCARAMEKLMATTPYDVLMAALHGRRAIRRGDLEKAERWLKVAERATAIYQRLAAIEHADAKHRPRRNPAQ
jgi:hypothetical protein